MNRVAPIAIALALSACAGSKNTAVADVSAAETALTAAGTAALAYSALPPCGPSAGPVCSNPTIKAQIRIAYDGAYAAVTAAQGAADSGGAPDMTTVQASLAELQGVLTGLPKSTGSK